MPGGLVDYAFNTDNVDRLKKAAKGEGEYAGKPESERWTAVATLSYRPQADENRNATIKQWFLAGAIEANAKEDAARQSLRGLSRTSVRNVMRSTVCRPALESNSRTSG